MGQRTPLSSCCDFVATPQDSQSGRSTLKDGDFLLILFLVSGGFAAISILVASIMKTRERFMGLGQALIMPLFFASNALYPIDMMPSALQLFAVLNPLTYAVDAIRGLMISGELGNILVDVLAILVFDMVVFALASLSFRKILE